MSIAINQMNDLETDRIALKVNRKIHVSVKCKMQAVKESQNHATSRGHMHLNSSRHKPYFNSETEVCWILNKGN